MAQAESNRVDIRISAETTWNETPTTPTMASLPYTSESLAYEKRTVKSNIVRADRATDDLIEVGAGSSGDINFEYKFGDFELLIAAALGNSTFATATFTGTSNLSFAASGGGVQVLTAPAATWNSFVVGTYVRVSGANAQNNGVWLVTAKDSTTLTVKNTAGTTQASTSATVAMKYARTSTTKKSFLVEKNFGDITQFISFRGMRVGTWGMNIEAEQIVTGSFGLVGAGAFGAGTTVSGSVTPAGSLSVASATANVGRLQEAGADLATKVKAVRFNVNANPRQLTAVANKYPIGINLGSFEITGTVEAYFEDLVLYNEFVNHTSSSLVVEVVSPESDNTIITFPKIKYSNAAPVGAGLNQDVMVTMDFTAIYDSTLGTMMQVDLLT